YYRMAGLWQQNSFRKRCVATFSGNSRVVQVIMNKILVLGYHGQVASSLRLLKANDASYTFLDREMIQAHNPSVITEILRSLNPSAVINCAAYTAVDKAETDQQACWALNSQFVGLLAALSSELDFHLIHFSTDYVFDGRGSRPYREIDQTGPVNYYGSSKLDGEKLILERAKSACIVRTSWVYSEFGANFVRTMLRLSERVQPLKVVSDQTGCPTYAGDLAELASGPLLTLRGKVELFHFSNEGEATWHEFAEEIMRLWKTEKKVERIRTIDFPTPALRPAYGVMDKQKITSALQLSVSHWTEALARCKSKWV
ncbi:MAG: dTDP-4-dehydrorhamnose reductase, partial [Proteobacteria bacterium]